MLPARLARNVARAAAVKLLAPDEPFDGFDINGALLERDEIEQAKARIVAVRHPVIAAFGCRASLGALGRRLCAGHELGLSIGPDAASPRQLLDERCRREQLAVAAVEYVKEAVAAGLNEKLAVPPP